MQGDVLRIMKILSWNCKMAYRKKADRILKLNPDLVVVPECENLGDKTSTRLWFGDNEKKGLGIFSYNTFEIEPYQGYDPSFRYVVPICVKGTAEFNLLAVWAMNDAKDVRKRYIGQIWLALNYYKELLDRPLIIIGDFNWNTIWDINPDYPLCGTLTDVIRVLESKKIHRAYHTFFGEEFGKESRPTLYMHHDKEKPYHVDYCFASEDFELDNVEVGEYQDWIKSSDHMPLIVSLRTNDSGNTS
jgi:exodeoxyribonuclease-3